MRKSVTREIIQIKCTHTDVDTRPMHKLKKGPSARKMGRGVLPHLIDKNAK